MNRSSSTNDIEAGPLTGLSSSVYHTVFSALLPGVDDPPLEGTAFFSFLDDYLVSIPYWSSLGLKALIWIVYLCPVFFIGRLRTLGGLGAEEREAYLLSWEKNRLYLVRQGFVLIKMIASIGYGGDPQFKRAIGYPQPHRPAQP